MSNERLPRGGIIDFVSRFELEQFRFERHKVLSRVLSRLSSLTSVIFTNILSIKI